MLGMTPLLSCAQDSLNVMFYNLYRFPVNYPDNREFLLKNIVAYARPDLLMACEIVDEAGAKRVLRTSFSSMKDSFARAGFVYSASAAGDPLQQTVFYNTRKLVLTEQETLLTSVRDINHYTFILNTTSNSDSVFLDVFVTHLKSSTGTTNELLRLAMIDTFTQALEHIPSDHHVLLAGDFNFYSSATEPAYQKILDSNNAVRMVDPIDMPGDWHNNPAFRAIHTQATRLTLDGFGLGGAGGGMDDRFDFIFMSANLRTGNDLHYQPGSYKAFGNNGNCFNRKIDNDTCVGIYPITLRHVLFQMSDHTPVIMQLLTDQLFPVGATSQQVPPVISLNTGNVVHNYLSLKINSLQMRHGALLFIYDYTGRILKRVAVTRPSFSIDIRLLTPGMYFLRMGGSVLKFIKR